MNLIKVQGQIFNLAHFENITFNDTNELCLWPPDDGTPYRIGGPEALAAWEWLQKACIWKMEPVDEPDSGDVETLPFSDELDKEMAISEDDRQLLLEGLDSIDGEIYNSHGYQIRQLANRIKTL